ncbi:hypothetical protein LXL04_005130 [Taraxacum kok-saghyz]
MERRLMEKQLGETDRDERDRMGRRVMYRILKYPNIKSLAISPLILQSPIEYILNVTLLPIRSRSSPSVSPNCFSINRLSIYEDIEDDELTEGCPSCDKIELLNPESERSNKIIVVPLVRLNLQLRFLAFENCYFFLTAKRLKYPNIKSLAISPLILQSPIEYILNVTLLPIRSRSSPSVSPNCFSINRLSIYEDNEGDEPTEGCPSVSPNYFSQLGVNEPSRARIPPSSARARLSCCRLELELGSFKVWYPSSSSAREKCKKLELGLARLVYLSSLNEPRLGSSSFMLFELD